MSLRLQNPYACAVASLVLCVCMSEGVAAACPHGADVVTVTAARHARVAAFQPDGSRRAKVAAADLVLPQKVCVKDSRGRLALDLANGEQVMVSQMQLKTKGTARALAGCDKAPGGRPIRRIEAVVAGAGTQCVFR